jgi:uncharacterized protein (TIGR00725 family)
VSLSGSSEKKFLAERAPFWKLHVETENGRSIRISVIGSGTCAPDVYDLARRTGSLIAARGWTLVCGGLGGVMEGAARGALRSRRADHRHPPGHRPCLANPYVTVPVATGLGPMRNYLVVLNGHAVVALEGGAGTLSEIGLALKIGRKVIAVGQWSCLPGVVRAVDPLAHG